MYFNKNGNKKVMCDQIKEAIDVLTQESRGKANILREIEHIC